ncbi:YHYH protein-domain-containing protein [Zopfochytrium polystomum]|nr:YHYH protein-domain-containing protein [Zopfochytrium polystomum]
MLATFLAAVAAAALALAPTPTGAAATCGTDQASSVTQVTCHTFNFPASPVISTSNYYIGTTSNANPPMGPLGVAVNGVSLYGNADANKRDAYLNEGSSFDTCGGHPTVTGDYHYHALTGPGCVYPDTKGSAHSPLFGLMADGIPIFGPYGDKGVVPSDLDECNGHTDSTYSFYHYHVTSTYVYPYLINCMKGCLNGSNLITGQSCTPAAKQYDYSSLSSLTNLTQKYSSFSCDTNTGVTKGLLISAAAPAASRILAGGGGVAVAAVAMVAWAAVVWG